MNVVRLSALGTGRIYPSGNIPGTHFCYRLTQPQGHSAAGRIMLMKNSNNTIGNRTLDLPAFSAVPQATASPRAPIKNIDHVVFSETIDYFAAPCVDKIHFNVRVYFL